MRRASVLFAVVVCFASVAHADEWLQAKTYTFKDGHVAARFPAEPVTGSTTRDTELGPLTAHTATFDDAVSGVELVLTWTKYPAKRQWPSAKDELDAFADDLVKGGKVKLVSQKDVKVAGHAGRQYRLTGGAGDVAIMQIVLAKPWIYFMAARVPAARAADYPFAAFLSSLKLL